MSKPGFWKLRLLGEELRRNVSILVVLPLTYRVKGVRSTGRSPRRPWLKLAKRVEAANHPGAAYRFTHCWRVVF